MFGKRRNNKSVAPVQGPVQGTILTASGRASVDPGMLILVHSRGQGSTPAHKALMARALANPPSRTNSMLAQGLASRGVAGFANSTAALANTGVNPAPMHAEPAKGDIAWDSIGPR